MSKSNPRKANSGRTTGYRAKKQGAYALHEDKPAYGQKGVKSEIQDRRSVSKRSNDTAEEADWINSVVRSSAKSALEQA